MPRTDAAASHPASLPMTSSTATGAAGPIVSTSRPIPIAASATNRAALPYPGEWSVVSRSLSMVLGTLTTDRGSPALRAASARVRPFSAESLPPMMKQ